jgi:hypothetical protein
MTIGAQAALVRVSGHTTCEVRVAYRSAIGTGRRITSVLSLTRTAGNDGQAGAGSC